MTTDEDQLVELSKKWSTAMNTLDRATLEELMAPDFVLHKWDHTRDIARATWFDFLFNHIKTTEFEQSPIVARVYGDVGVVTSKFSIWAITFDDKPMGEINGYLMDVWRRTNGRWQVVSRTSQDLPGRAVAPATAPEAGGRKPEAVTAPAPVPSALHSS